MEKKVILSGIQATRIITFRKLFGGFGELDENAR